MSNHHLLFAIPQPALRYILWQRTELQRWSRFSSHLINLEAFLRSNAIREGYCQKLFKEFQELKPYLPLEPIKAVADIGCGVAGIDVLISRSYQSSKSKFYLIDKTQLDHHIHYGLQPQGEFYNSLSVAKALLVENQIDPAQIELVSADHIGDRDIPQLDLIISLISWGYHYPVETYHAWVLKNLKPGGRLILDIRKGSGGEKILKQDYGKSEVVMEDSKRVRFVFIK
jgi:SAM-dependent methyltransferase